MAPECKNVYLGLGMFLILARELESTETFPGLASPFLVSFKDGFMMSEKSFNDESHCDFTKKILV